MVRRWPCTHPCESVLGDAIRRDRHRPFGLEVERFEKAATGKAKALAGRADAVCRKERSKTQKRGDRGRSGLSRFASMRLRDPFQIGRAQRRVGVVWSLLRGQGAADAGRVVIGDLRARCAQESWRSRRNPRLDLTRFSTQLLECRNRQLLPAIGDWRKTPALKSAREREPSGLAARCDGSLLGGRPAYLKNLPVRASSVRECEEGHNASPLGSTGGGPKIVDD